MGRNYPLTDELKEIARKAVELNELLKKASIAPPEIISIHIGLEPKPEIHTFFPIEGMGPPVPHLCETTRRSMIAEGAYFFTLFSEEADPDDKNTLA